MRIDSYELSHLILRFEQEKDMKPMHCVQNLGALRDLVDARIELAGLRKLLREMIQLPRPWNAVEWRHFRAEMEKAVEE